MARRLHRIRGVIFAELKLLLKPEPRTPSD